MIDSLKKIYSLFPTKARYKLLGLFFMMILASFLEVLGIGMIPVFIILIADPDKVLATKYLGELLIRLGLTDVKSLALAGAVALIVVFLIKNAYLTIYQYIKVKFVTYKKLYLQNRVFEAYMFAPYSFYNNRNSAELLRNVNIEVGKIVNGTIMPVLEISLNLIMFVLILTGLIFFEPLITLLTVLMMGGGGFIFLKLTRMKSLESGKVSRDAKGHMNRIILQGIGAFKDARVLNREKEFLKQYNFYAKQHVDASIYQTVVKSLPRPIIETLIIIGILSITIFMINEGREFSQIIPVLTLFGVAAVKLMPIFNNIINQITTINYSAPSVYTIFEDLELLENTHKEFRKLICSKHVPIRFENEIQIHSVSYQYPGSNEYALDDISLTIPKGKSIAFVGVSGAGKTTLVNIILGLLEPNSGYISVDGKNIYKNIRGWMELIGYIQQANYLLDDRIYRNIAFGLPDEEIDKKRLDEVIKAAQLDELIQKLPYGIKTRTGERGTKLSGGQMQRIGIARALYNNPQILVMDEATSALDNITEKFVIDAIEKLKGNRTFIIIAHRLTTVKNCDMIYLLENGRLIGNGTYGELIETSEEFRKMSLTNI
jgi:ABC-type multidrug transport system fused ATPase/permease subunit